MSSRQPPPLMSRSFAAIGLIIGLSVLIEGVLFAADHGWIGSPRWRGIAYQNGAFWAGLLHGWRPNYTAQPWVMFLSYAGLHGGVWHLLGNMLTLAILAQILATYISQRRIVVLYALSAIGGALCFGLLTRSPQPMVGASGALFGLVGAWQYYRWTELRRAGHSRWPVWQTLLGLVLMNIIMWITLDGLLAWETHLGGCITGAVGAACLAWLRPARSKDMGPY